MDAERYEKYAELLRGGYGPITCAVPAFMDLPGDMLVVMASNPEAFERSGVVLVNSNLLEDAGLQVSFAERLRTLYAPLAEEMTGAEMDLVQVAIAYFTGAMELGHIDPQQGPLSDAVRLSDMGGWKAEAIAAYVYREHIDGRHIQTSEVGQCGSQQEK